MKTYTIYKLTSPSGKVYIGQTVSITKRFQCYKYVTCKTQVLLYKSLLKYGWDNFIKEILEVGLNKLEANEFEIKYIKEYQDLNISLNIHRGGYINRTPEIISQFSLEGEFLKNWDSVEEISIFYKIKPASVRAACKRKKNEHEGFLWLYKKDYDKGISPTKSNIRSREEIVQLSKEGKYIITYKNLKQCLAMTQAKKGNIIGCLLKLQRSAGGFIFFYKSEYNPELNYSTSIKPTRIDSKVVIKYDLEGNFLQEYASLKLAELDTGVSKGSISSMCRKGIKRFNKNRKFIFKFK